MAGEYRLPNQHEIESICLAFQSSWSPSERRKRKAGVDHSPLRWSVRQYLVHHAQSGQWVGGTCHMTQVWRCVDGR